MYTHRYDVVPYHPPLNGPLLDLLQYLCVCLTQHSRCHLITAHQYRIITSILIAMLFLMQKAELINHWWFIFHLSTSNSMSFFARLLCSWPTMCTGAWCYSSFRWLCSFLYCFSGHFFWPNSPASWGNSCMTAHPLDLSSIRAILVWPEYVLNVHIISSYRSLIKMLNGTRPCVSS